MLLTYFKGIFNHLPLIGAYSEQLLYVVMIVPVILALPALVNKFCLADYLFYLLLVLYYLSCYCFFPDNSVYLNQYAFLCLCCVFPYYFIGRMLDIDEFFDMLVFLSTVCIAMDLFYFLTYAPGNKNMDEVAGADNMFAAYQALPHVTMLLWATLEKFRVWKAVVFVLGVLFLLSCGTRGPLVCLGFFGLVYFFFYMNFKGAVYVKIGIIGLGVLMLAFLRDIALFLYQTYTELQLSTRIIEKFIIGDLGNDSFRSVLRTRLYELLENEGHFWGFGLFGSQNYGVPYAHFMPLDFWFTFGYTVGSLLLVLVFSVIVWAIYLTKGQTAQKFILFLLSLSLVKMMMTGTFPVEHYFYFLLGFCFKVILDNSVVFRHQNAIVGDYHN